MTASAASLFRATKAKNRADGAQPILLTAALLAAAQQREAGLLEALQEIDARGPDTGQKYDIAFDLSCIARAALRAHKGEKGNG